MYFRVAGNSICQIPIGRLLAVWAFIVIGLVNCQVILQILYFEEEELSSESTQGSQLQINNLDDFRKIKSANVNIEQENNLVEVSTSKDILLQEPDSEFEEIEAYYELLEDPVVLFEIPQVNLFDPTPCQPTLARCIFLDVVVRYKWNNDTQQCVPFRMCRFQAFQSQQECENQCG